MQHLCPMPFYNAVVHIIRVLVWCGVSYHTVVVGWRVLAHRIIELKQGERQEERMKGKE